MRDKVLDLGRCTIAEFNNITSDFERFILNDDRVRYFGYVDKNNIADICKRLEYADTKMRSDSRKHGFVVGAAVTGIGLLVYKAKKARDEIDL